MAKARERKKKDLGNVTCVRDEDGKVLVDEAQVKERWKWNSKDDGH